MHERNPYKTPIDFAALSEAYLPLKQFLTNHGNSLTIDFKNTDAQRCLTEALLLRDFQLKFALPEGRLCPPVPNRLNYLLWIQDLLTESFRCFEKKLPEVLGIDIGTGASAIYPLLGCKVDPSWKFIGTEIDSISYASAIRNVEVNNLSDRIRVCGVASENTILTPFKDEPTRNFTFTMCNPPFYADAKDIQRSSDGKILEPNSVCTGAEVEMIVKGGEEFFVQRMVTESAASDLRDRCMWFTSMLGKFSSVEEIVNSLRTLKVDNYALTELVQGQTRRWVVAWSLGDIRVPDNIARDLPSTHHTLLPPPNMLRQPLKNSSETDLNTISDIVKDVLTALDGIAISVIPCVYETAHPPPGSEPPTNSILSLRVSAARNTWSRAARRANKSVQPSHQTEATPLALVLDISAERERLKTGEGWVLVGLWRRGRERELFEGFWGHVTRKVGAALDALTISHNGAGSVR